MTLYVGDDWAEAHHDVHLMNGNDNSIWPLTLFPRAQ